MTLSPVLKELPTTLRPQIKGCGSGVQLVDCVIAFLDQNKAEDIFKIDLRGKTSFADFMVITSGTSGRFITSLADKVKAFLHEQGVRDVHIEGTVGDVDWVLIDGGDIIIHLFKPEAREAYNLEGMWRGSFKDEEA